MKANFIIAALLIMGSTWDQNKALAQFYPDSLANWCLHNSVSPEGFDIIMHMLNDPDTIINGLVYKRIDEILLPNSWPTCFPRYYIRSEADGKGYMYLPELGTEYMTGDLNASVSDTIHDVLIEDGTLSCGGQIQECPYSNLVLADVVVLAIDTITAAGVTVVRHSVWPLCSGTWVPLFWQGGIGTQHGPLMMMSASLAYLFLKRVSVGDTCYYNSSTMPQGLPGGPACCLVIENSVGEYMKETSEIHIYPNPNSGIFTVDISAMQNNQTHNLSVQDALGRTTYTTTTNSQINTVDLRGRSGLFLLIVEGGGSRWSTRIIIE